MKVSAAAELAVRGAIVLAEKYGRGPITLDQICARRDLPKQYLVKIFASLTRAGLVMPIRGKNGGYMLARTPSRISLLNIIEAVEGPLAMNYCQQDPPQCQEEDCPMRSVWAELQHAVHDRLAAFTLADCVSRQLSQAAEPG